MLSKFFHLEPSKISRNPAFRNLKEFQHQESQRSSMTSSRPDGKSQSIFIGIRFSIANRHCMNHVSITFLFCSSSKKSASKDSQIENPSSKRYFSISSMIWISPQHSPAVRQLYASSRIFIRGTTRILWSGLASSSNSSRPSSSILPQILSWIVHSNRGFFFQFTFAAGDAHGSQAEDDRCADSTLGTTWRTALAYTVRVFCGKSAKPWWSWHVTHP